MKENTDRKDIYVYMYVCICSSIGTWGGGGGQLKNHEINNPNFYKLLILMHLRNYFIEILNKFLMCFEIMSQKILS